MELLDVRGSFSSDLCCDDERAHDSEVVKADGRPWGIFTSSTQQWIEDEF